MVNIVFFGTPEFAVPALRACIERFHVVCCVTQPDTRKGRGKQLAPCAVKQEAASAGIPVLQPTTLRRDTEDGSRIRAQLLKSQPDLAVVASYGKIIPADVLEMVPNGFLNIHPSLLPRYRGASPLQAAIMNGDAATGVTIMKMDAGMDTGPICSQESVELPPAVTLPELHDMLAAQGAELLMRTIPPYLAGEIRPTPQDDSNASTTSMLSRQDGKIDWSLSAEQIERMIRAYNPWPGSYTFCNNRRIRVLSAHLNGRGQLVVDTVQPESKPPTDYRAFLNGYPDCRLPPQAG